MNLGKEIKEEIISKPIKDISAIKAFLSGLIRGSGVLFERDNRLGFEFKVFDENTYKLVCYYFNLVFKYPLTSEKSGSKKYTVNVTGDVATNILQELCIIENSSDELIVYDKYPERLLCHEICEKSFIKGLFISSGSCTIPEEKDSVKAINTEKKRDTNKTGYHLQITCSHSTFASVVSDVLVKNRINVKISKNKDKYLIYLKSAEEIKDFIAYLSAPKSVLKITDLIINRDFYNGVNRRKNCDLGNVNRQLEASLKQKEAIELIESKIGLNALKEDLRVVAKARMEFLDDSITELADKLNITKSCVNHRMRKIMQVAKEIKE